MESPECCLKFDVSTCGSQLIGFSDYTIQHLDHTWRATGDIQFLEAGTVAEFGDDIMMIAMIGGDWWRGELQGGSSAFPTLQTSNISSSLTGRENTKFIFPFLTFRYRFLFTVIRRGAWFELHLKCDTSSVFEKKNMYFYQYSLSTVQWHWSTLVQPKYFELLELFSDYFLIRSSPASSVVVEG